MPIMLCSPGLWRYVRAWRTARDPDAPGDPPGTLGLWASTVIARGGRDVVLSVESRTYFTVLCELGAESTFRVAWKRSLASALDDVHVPAAVVASDIFVPPRLVPLTDGRLTAVLATVEFVCDIELYYQSDLRIVQRGLNEFPHDRPPDYAPMLAVQRLFGVRARD